MMPYRRLTVVGAGLAGCEAAWQAAKCGVTVTLYEMKPLRKSPAHQTDSFAELVCSNSFRADRLENAVGLLKEEMRRLDSLIIHSADQTRVPAGGALAVDRDEFSRLVTYEIEKNNRIEVIRSELKSIPEDETVIIATGPLTDNGMLEAIMERVGRNELHFFDAAAPIVSYSGIDRGIAFAASRYGKGGEDYLNCPMNEEEYHNYRGVDIRRACNVKNFDKEAVLKDVYRSRRWQNAVPIQYDRTLGPVGLIDPRTGRMPLPVLVRQDI